MEVLRHPPLKRSLRPSTLPYRSGAWTPVTEEVDASHLEVVEGKIPTDIDGVYLRNTENPVHEPIGKYHPFDGDGMIHQISFRDGKASYRNRWVRTKALMAEQEAGQALWAGLAERPTASIRPGQCCRPGLKDASSTDVVVHAGMALSTFYQCGEAYRLDPETLEQLGPAPWSPIDGVSAHPKVDERTGELMFFNYSLHAPHMHFGTVDRHNLLTTYVPVPLSGPRLPHDMAFSQNYVILNDMPLYWDPDLIPKGVFATRLFNDQTSRFAVIPRHDASPENIRWFEATPTYVLHWLNAHEQGDELILDGYFQEDPAPAPKVDAPPGYGHMLAFLDLHALRPRLHRWRFNLATGQTREERLSDEVVEFGMINQRYAGRPYRYVYSALAEKGVWLLNGLMKHDLHSGQTWKYEYGPGVYGSEAPFAPRVGAKDEDDGYLVTFTIDEARGLSECLLIDAKHIETGPVCRVRLPHKLCSGVHSTWAGRDFLRNGFVP